MNSSQTSSWAIIGRYPLHRSALRSEQLIELPGIAMKKSGGYYQRRQSYSLQQFLGEALIPEIEDLAIYTDLNALDYRTLKSAWDLFYPASKGMQGIILSFLLCCSSFLYRYITFLTKD
jgi:hypothetical protein